MYCDPGLPGICVHLLPGLDESTRISPGHLLIMKASLTTKWKRSARATQREGYGGAGQDEPTHDITDTGEEEGGGGGGGEEDEG